MNFRTDKWVLVTAAALAMAVAGSASATNGYFTHGVGSKSKALAGSGSADPDEVLVIATNPAGLAFVDGRLEVGLGAFSPMRDYRTTPSQLPDAAYQAGAFTIGDSLSSPRTGNDLSSKNELFFIPYIAKNWRRDEQNALALAFYARGGMNTEWQGGHATFDPDGPGTSFPTVVGPGTYGAGIFGGDGKAGVDLMQAFLNLTYAWNNPSRTASVGVSAIVGIQRFEATGVATFAPYTRTFAASGGTAQPTHLSNNGYDMSYGYGGAVGFQWHPNDTFGFAAAYTSKLSMSKLDKYRDLFAQGGGFDIPAQLDVGIAVHFNPRVTLTADVQQIYYEGVASVSNPIQNLFACPTAGQGGTDLESCLGGERGGGFGWRDMTVYKAGVAWQVDDDWTARIGASTAKQPIRNSQMSFNILAPGVMEEHYTFGFTRKLSGGREFNMAFMYAPKVKVTGPQNFDPTQTVQFQMDQWDLEFSYAWGK
jgi:long-chain fatty acid transport protein